MPYRLNETTELIDYDQVLELPLVSILAQCVFTLVTLTSSLGMASNGRLRTKKVFCDISLYKAYTYLVQWGRANKFPAQ
jgi:hypothetical protein